MFTSKFSNAFTVQVLLLVGLAATVGATFVNDEVERRVDLSSSGGGALVPRVKVEAKVSGGSGDAYEFWLPKGEAHPSFRTLNVKVDGKKQDLTLCKNLDTDSVDYTRYCIENVPVDGFSLSISYLTGLLLKPFPESIKQLEHQLLLLDQFPSTWYSPYETATQTLTLRVPNRKVESYTKEGVKVSFKDKSIVYGPFDGTKPLTSGVPISVHFESNSAQRAFSSVEREVEVSLWGNVAVEEHHNLFNGAAALKGGFSRLDYQEKQERSGTLTGGVWIPSVSVDIPAGAQDYYYRDQIGNISTSSVEHKESSIVLNLKPRFPIFGGWRTNYYVGYNMDFDVFESSGVGSLKTDGNSKYELSYLLQHAVPESFVEKMTMKVVLPEGAENVVVSSGNVEYQLDKRFTYLDSVGRTTIEFELKNFNSKSKAVPIRIQFEGKSTQLLWRKPLLLSGSFMAVYLFYIFASRIELGIKN